MSRLANLDPKKREQYLMILCGAMLLVAAIPIGLYLFGSDVSKMRNQIEAAKKSVAELETKRRASLTFEKQIKQNAADALPVNKELAVAEYKNWLTTLLVGFEGGQVTNTGTTTQQARMVRNRTGNQGPVEYYANFKFNVSGKTTLQDMGQFLQRFYEVKTQHLIRSMTISPIDNGRIDVSMTIEAISIPQTPNKSFTADKKEGDETEWSRMIAAMVERNFFASYVPPKPEGEQKPEPVVVSASKHTYLNGITWSNDRPQAWFNFRLEGRQGIMKIGDRFRIGEANCRVEAINLDRTVELRVELRDNGTGQLSRTVWALRPGDTLYDAEFLRDLDEEEENAQSATTTPTGANEPRT